MPKRRDFPKYTPQGDGRRPKEKQPPAGASKSDNPSDNIKRDVLPLPDVRPPTLTTFDARDPDTKYPPIRDLRPPSGAPNVLIVLIDDAGFGSSSGSERAER